MISAEAAGGEFSRGVLSAAYGGAILTGGLAAVPVGRVADRHGVRWLIAAGSMLGAAGLLAFSAARAPWQVSLAWWVLIGPATAMTFYEPAYVLIRQAFAPQARAQAIAVLTLSAGFSGPVFTPATGALVEALGWRDATRVLAAALACAAPLALLFLRARPPRSDGRAGTDRPRRAAHLALFRQSHLLRFTIGAVLAYGAIEAIVVHRIARFLELGFGLPTVTLWAAIAGLLTLPGRFLLPMLGRRMRPTTVLALVLGVLTVSTVLMIGGRAYWQMALSFVLFGLVFGAALPLRAIVMNQWVATAVYGSVMGVQAALIAVGRAGIPVVVGVMHDVLDTYTLALALLTGLLAVAMLLVGSSGASSPAAPTRQGPTDPGRSTPESSEAPTS